MGGHGGLNILPQKEWNVYRVDRQFQVKYDYHRKVESELAKKDLKIKKDYNDTLVKLKRSRNRSSSNDRNEPCSDESESRELIRAAVRSHVRSSLSNRSKREADSEEDSADEQMRYLRGDDEDHHKPKGFYVMKEKEKEKDTSKSEDTTEDTNVIVPFRLFEKEEKQHLRRQRERREQLIKSSCYVYNGSDKDPKNFNLYTDTTAKGKQSLVSDFKQFAEAETPWYNKQCEWYKEKPENIKNIANENTTGKTKSKFASDSVNIADVLKKERLEREAKERERARLLKMKRGTQQ